MCGWGFLKSTNCAMSTPLQQIQARIVSTEADLAEAKRFGDIDRRDRLETLLIEQQREKNILLAREPLPSASSASGATSNVVLIIWLFYNVYV